MVLPKTLSRVISGRSSEFATSPHSSISRTWEWQGRNVLPTFSFMYLHLSCFTAIKFQTTCFIKQIAMTCCLSAGKSLCLWSLEWVQHPEEVLASHPHLNQHLEICQPLGFHPFHPKSLNADLVSITQSPGLGWCSKIHTIKWGSSCKVNYNF